MSAFSDVNETRGAIVDLLHALLVVPLEGNELTSTTSQVFTASAYTDHRGETMRSIASITAAINSYALSEGLTLRDAIAEKARVTE